MTCLPHAADRSPQHACGWWLSALLLAGCASYQPHPLARDPAVLNAPEAAVIATRADAIRRPWLTPVRVDLAAPMTPDAIALLAVLNNPDLIALRRRAGIADAQSFAAGLLPDPSFSIGADKVLRGPDTLLGFAGALVLDLDALRKRAVTREQARDQARQVRLDLAWAEWQTAGQARIQAIRVRALAAMVGLARASADAAQAQRQRMLQAAARGDVSASEAEIARIAAFDASERWRTAERDQLLAEHALTRLLGVPPDTPITLADSALPAAPPAAETLFGIAAAERSDLAALRAGYAAQEASVHRAVLDQFPTLNLTINDSRDTAGNYLLGPAVDFTLPLWNRNRGRIAVERTTREALQAEYEARLFQTRADIAAAVSGIELARRQRQQALAGLTALEARLAASDAAARRGDLSQALAANARQQWRDRELLIAQAELAIREQTVALELLSGEPMEAWR